MPSSSREQRANIDALSDPFARTSLRAAYHLRKYSFLYVVAVLGLVALSLFPTYGGGSGTGGSKEAAAGAGIYGSTSSAPQAAGAAPGGQQAAVPAGTGGDAATAPSGVAPAGTQPAAPSAGGGTGGTATSPSQQSAHSNTVQVGSGTTRGGFACKPGVRQLPYSVYAAPCVAKYTGDNGGKTWNGVTKDTITIAVRHTADSQGANAQASQAQSAAAGAASYDDAENYTKKLAAYFNKTFELYGRQVKLVDFNGQGNYTNEELGQGQAEACADADGIANSAHAFMAIDYEGMYEWGPFAACAARYKLMTPQGAPYFPESFYQKYHPYVWSTIMNCQLIAQHVAEFIGKQIAPYKAKWAGMNGAQNMQNTPRKFGTYVPNNAEYQECVRDTQNALETKYGVSKQTAGDQYNYALDISQFPNDAQRAIVQFAANKDTTIILACDPISTIFLTRDASNQNYHPEWLLIGVAYQDTDNYAQLWDQSAVSGRLFGLSQASSTNQLLDPNGEAGKALKAAGVPFNITSVSRYYELLSIYNQLQAAGPQLTPANIAAGTAGLPRGGPGPWGTWYFGKTHTAVIDSREIYYDANKTSPSNGKQGTYVAVYNDRRFKVGEYPSQQPPFYPGS